MLQTIINNKIEKSLIMSVLKNASDFFGKEKAQKMGQQFSKIIKWERLDLINLLNTYNAVIIDTTGEKEILVNTNQVISFDIKIFKSKNAAAVFCLEKNIELPLELLEIWEDSNNGHLSIVAEVLKG